MSVAGFIAVGKIKFCKSDSDGSSKAGIELELLLAGVRKPREFSFAAEVSETLIITFELLIFEDSVSFPPSVQIAVFVPSEIYYRGESCADIVLMIRSMSSIVVNLIFFIFLLSNFHLLLLN